MLAGLTFPSSPGGKHSDLNAPHWLPWEEALWSSSDLCAISPSVAHRPVVLTPHCTSSIERAVRTCYTIFWWPNISFPPTSDLGLSLQLWFVWAFPTGDWVPASNLPAPTPNTHSCTVLIVATTPSCWVPDLDSSKFSVSKVKMRCYKRRVSQAFVQSLFFLYANTSIFKLKYNMHTESV